MTDKKNTTESLVLDFYVSHSTDFQTGIYCRHPLANEFKLALQGTT